MSRRIVLERAHGQRTAAQRCHSLRGSVGAGDGREVEHPGVEGGAPDGACVLGGTTTGGGVDDHLDAAVGEQLRNIGLALTDLEDLLDCRETGVVKNLGGALGGADLETELLGTRQPAANAALAKASPNDRPRPMTSPVDRISGPGRGSTPGKRSNGKTGSLTAT